MTSSNPLLEDYYELFQSHLLGSVLGLLWDSPTVRALMEGAGVELLNDFLLHPSSYYWSELTYVEMEEDGSVALKELHPIYLHLLMAFYWWCRTYIRSNRIPPYADWLRTTRADFLCYLEGVLWKSGEVPPFTFPIIRVLPGTLLRVLSRPPVPVQVLPLVQPDIGPNDEERVLSSQESSLEVLSVLPASLDHFLGLVSNPTCSLDILLSLATNIIIPSCSFDVSLVPPDNSYCLMDDSSIPLENHVHIMRKPPMNYLRRRPYSSSPS